MLAENSSVQVRRHVGTHGRRLAAGLRRLRQPHDQHARRGGPCSWRGRRSGPGARWRSWPCRRGPGGLLTSSPPDCQARLELVQLSRARIAAAISDAHTPAGVDLGRSPTAGAAARRRACRRTEDELDAGAVAGTTCSAAAALAGADPGPCPAQTELQAQIPRFLLQLGERQRPLVRVHGAAAPGPGVGGDLTGVQLGPADQQRGVFGPVRRSYGETATCAFCMPIASSPGILGDQRRTSPPPCGEYPSITVRRGSAGPLISEDARDIPVRTAGPSPRVRSRGRPGRPGRKRSPDPAPSWPCTAAGRARRRPAAQGQAPYPLPG